MSKKFSERFSEMTDEELKKEYEGLYDVIENVEVFSDSDMWNLQAIETELEKRGYIIEESKKVRIIKEPKLKEIVEEGEKID